MNTNTTTPQATETEIKTLCARLEGKGWRRAAALVTELPGWDDRKIRAVANAADGRIISDQNGYRLTSEATAREIESAWKRLMHQADAMKARAVQIKTFAEKMPQTQADFFGEPKTNSMDERGFLNRR